MPDIGLCVVGALGDWRVGCYWTRGQQSHDQTESNLSPVQGDPTNLTAERRESMKTLSAYASGYGLAEGGARLEATAGGDGNGGSCGRLDERKFVVDRLMKIG